MFSHLVASALLAALVAPAAAQTSTLCNPLHQSCPSDPALGTTFNQTFTTGSSLDSNYWSVAASPAPVFNSNGGSFTITQHGDAPTIQSSYYIFWGRVEVIMKAATGQGIISSIVLLSDDLDEIDWEIMGGNTTHVETNYYGKGNTSQINSEYFPCNGPQDSFHNYTTVWTSSQIEWHLDGNIVRTLPFSAAVDNGKTIFPQTPSYLKIGSWAAGDPQEPQGTIAWAGGVVNYSDGPFTMFVQSVKVTDGTTNSTSYSYQDQSGIWQSIKVTDGISNANQQIHAPPPLTAAQRWANLSTGVKIAIISVSAAAFVALLTFYIFWCIKQRRLGRKERALDDARWEQAEANLLEQKQRWARGDFAKTKIAMVQQHDVGTYF